MKSRAIALGASVIAFTLTSGGQALAAGVGDLANQSGATGQRPHRGAVNGPAGAVTVEGNVKVPRRAFRRKSQSRR